MTRMIIFFDGILIMTSSLEEMTPVERDKLHLLQALGFLTNVKESVLEPFQA